MNAPPALFHIPLVFFMSITASAAAPETVRAEGSSSHPESWHTLMPLPLQVTRDAGMLPVDAMFAIALDGQQDAVVERAALRTLQRLAAQTGVLLNRSLVGDDQKPKLLIRCERPTAEIQSAVEDESYTLTVTPEQARLNAPSRYGVLRGLETFLQLVEVGTDGFVVPCVTIKDAPRFPWRGVLIDVCRHWIPKDVLKRNLDAMAAVKLNVFHWHLTEDQAFRIESKRFPAMHRKGSNGQYFTQEDVREIVGYARDRGIRVVPEFDMPGHTTSWFAGHPELASAPGPYEPSNRWGVQDPSMDPTREDVYALLNQFLEEMAALFPDQYVHIGGDEVTGKHWDGNAKIQEFKRAQGMQANHDLQVYFNQRILKILQGHGKKMVGWDEIFHPALPKDIVVQSWRGHKSLAAGARQGYQGILSYGYYLDHQRPASYHYGIDPLDKSVADLTREESGRILGGEACMWAEFVTPENIDSRIWPRAAAIAERLWSRADVNDVADMYRRLNATSQRLDWLGVTHRSGYPLMLQRMTRLAPITALQVLADVVEPVKLYERALLRTYTTTTPLNRLVDAARPESEKARMFAAVVDRFLSGGTDARLSESLRAQLYEWLENDGRLASDLQGSFLLEELRPLSRALSDVAQIGVRVLNALQAGTGLSASEKEDMRARLDAAGKQHAEVLLVIVPAVRRLVEGPLPGVLR